MILDFATLIFLHNMYTDQLKEKGLVGNMVVYRKRDQLDQIKQLLIDQKHCSKYLLDYNGNI